MGLGRPTEPARVLGVGLDGASVRRNLGVLGQMARVLAPNMTQPHVVDGLDRICRGLGGVSRVWRFDRMATVA